MDLLAGSIFIFCTELCFALYLALLLQEYPPLLGILLPAPPPSRGHPTARMYKRRNLYRFETSPRALVGTAKSFEMDIRHLIIVGESWVC